MLVVEKKPVFFKKVKLCFLYKINVAVIDVSVQGDMASVMTVMGLFWKTVFQWRVSRGTNWHFVPCMQMMLCMIRQK